MALEDIEEGLDVFVHNGDTAIGAVRRVGVHDFTVYVENAGDFVVSRAAVRDVIEGKVLLDADKLDPALKRAIGHAHDAEDPNVASR